MEFQSLNQSELVALIIGLLALTWAAGWKFFQWITTAPVAPDPWSAEVATEIANDGCPQICHRCLAPHDSSVHFCQTCGASVGTYTCLMPPLYLYSIGDVFRSGVEGNYRRSSFLTAGYFFMAFVYVYWVPFPLGVLVLLIYWNKLIKNIPQRVKN